MEPIRRARMSRLNARSAPKGWEAVVADLAERHADELLRHQYILIRRFYDDPAATFLPLHRLDAR